MVRRSGDCIMIAATLRHTAAAVANVNSEIHIATDSLFLLSLRLILLERAVNAEPCDPFRELSEIFRYYDTFFCRLIGIGRPGYNLSLFQDGYASSGFASSSLLLTSST